MGGLYNYQWQKARLAHRQEHPLCVMCLAEDRTTAATVVDHINEHKGDLELFWDRDNWQSLCKPHHDSTKQQIERNGYHNEIGADGWPIDGNHPSNR